MIVKLYAIFDRASGVYDGPMPSKTDGLVTRGFIDMANNKDHPIGKHPEDYTVFELGTWNDATGEIIPSAPKKVINGAEASDWS